MEKEKGSMIMEMINSVRRLYTDIAKIIEQFDTVFKNNQYKNKGDSSSITSGNSSSLNRPENWLPEGFYRLYYQNSNSIKGFNIAFNKEDAEPLFIGGKIEYPNDPVGNVPVWDIWDNWYQPNNKYLADGKIYNITPIRDIKACRLFAIPLIDIKNNETIEEITKKIIAL